MDLNYRRFSEGRSTKAEGRREPTFKNVGLRQGAPLALCRGTRPPQWQR
ncbi:hypothetical protein COO91_05187 [Nostoc flagelliforme CCNUN1]|uniref:Uncharacterized protein n=1 Tax=Nostoc flagelliforme CCNUN1 TaxID=2038116 RepID=A0A2K8SWR3_9NOSO|nr:hypothetical protein COO91_05187 [Nostoc flagelliforme CCNUN1]